MFEINFVNFFSITLSIFSQIEGTILYMHI